MAIATNYDLIVYSWSNESKNKLKQNDQIIRKVEKSVCFNYTESSSITSIVWPINQLHSIVYGTSDGTTNMCNIQTKKIQLLHKCVDSSYVVALAFCLTGEQIISAHLDGSIYKVSLPSKSHGGVTVSKIIHHTSCPSSVGWGRSICIGSNDQRIVFYNEDGTMIKFFDYVTQEGASPICKEFTIASFNSSGNSVVLGNFNCFYSFSWNSLESTWLENDKNIVDNMHSVTALSWKGDDSSLSVGTICGVVDIYDTCLKKHRYKDLFVTYISLGQILIQDKDNKIIAKLNSSNEIFKISFHRDNELNTDRFVVARTNKSLILCDLDFPTFISEITWMSDGISEQSEQFIFDFFKVCIVDNYGELSIIQVSHVCDAFTLSFKSNSIIIKCKKIVGKK